MLGYKKLHFHWQHLLALAGGILILLPVRPLLAQEDDPGAGDSQGRGQEHFVYSASYFDGEGYASAFVPPTVTTIYLQAGVDNVLAPRETVVFYWPLTNQYLADWQRLNNLKEGSLVIAQGGRTIGEFELETYITQVDNDDPANTLVLYTGGEAEEKYQEWSQAQEAYRLALFQFSQDEDEWKNAMTKLFEEYGPGNVPEDEIPPLPVKPELPSISSSRPAQGFVINLKPGTYDIRLQLPDGSVEEDSIKQLIVFENQGSAIAYNILPADRWTVPEESANPNHVIYIPGGTTVYLQPFNARVYNERYFVRMRFPQDQVARPDRQLWQAHLPNPAKTLRVSDGTEVTEIPLKFFYVEQRTGSRGYTIVTFDPNVHNSSSFGGFEIAIRPGGRYLVELLDENGSVIAGSRREIRALPTGLSPYLYGLSALPLVAGAVVLLVRRSSTRQIKQQEITQ